MGEVIFLDFFGGSGWEVLESRVVLDLGVDVGDDVLLLRSDFLEGLVCGVVVYGEGVRIMSGMFMELGDRFSSVGCIVCNVSFFG